MLILIIRILGALCFCFGALVVIHDINTIFVYGEPDATILAAIVALERIMGGAEWLAFLIWITPMTMGAVMLLATRSGRPRRER